VGVNEAKVGVAKAEETVHPGKERRGRGCR